VKSVRPEATPVLELLPDLLKTTRAISTECGFAEGNHHD
jgi:hypothetical protein